MFMKILGSADLIAAFMLWAKYIPDEGILGKLKWIIIITLVSKGLLSLLSPM